MKKTFIVPVIVFFAICSSCMKKDPNSVCHRFGGVPQRIAETNLTGDGSGDTLGWAVVILGYSKGERGEHRYGIDKKDADAIRLELDANFIDSVSVYDICTDKGVWVQTNVDRFYEGARLN